MINENELRQGNYLQHPKYGIGECVFGLGGFDLMSRSFSIKCLSECEPIPITPAILEAAGFEKGNRYDNYIISINDDKDYSVKYGKDWTGENSYWWISNDESDAGCYIIANVLYLHELQNVLFAVEKFELEVNIKEVV
jgi:hypothetical protein